MKNIFAYIIILFTSLSAHGQAEEIKFISEGKKLNAYFYKAHDSKSNPTLLWLHGNPGRKEAGKSETAIELAKNGINVFRFNYQGLWGNEGAFSLGNAIRDLTNAMDLLTSEAMRKAYHIDTNKIYVGGNSFGSSTALIGALYDERINKIIGVSLCDHSYFAREFMDPNSEIRDFLEAVIDDLFLPNGIIKQDKDIFIKDLTDHIYKYDFVKQADKFKDKQLYLFTGLDDRVCPIESHFIPFYRRLKELNHRNLEVVVKKCDHGLNCETPTTFAEVITNFIMK